VAAAVALGGVGLARGTWAIGGSDSACYALMADAFARGQLQPTSALADAPWPDAALTLAPAGFVPAPASPGAASPICAPGFSLLLVPLVLIAGSSGVFLVTPLAGAGLVWLSFVLTRRMTGAWLSAAAALLVASSPIVLFQVVQPMNDVTTAALWLGAVVALTSEGWRARWFAGGVLTGCALLVRPNLLPVGLAVTGWVWAAARDDGAADGWRARGVAVLQFATGAGPFGLIVLALNDMLYGSALRSGYGDASQLFAWANVLTNLARHGRALWETHVALPLLGLAAPWVAHGRPGAVVLAWLVAVAVVLCYLPYQSFAEWWYLRFLMPSVVLLTALAGASIAPVLSPSRVGAGGVALASAAIVGLVAYQVHVARQRQAFELHLLESRYRLVAEAMRNRLPPRTVGLSVWDSGSIRFHAGREAVLWDSLDPAWLDRALDWLLSQNHPPVIVVERWEEAGFRARFAEHSPLGALDWPPRLDVDGRVRVYDPADRARHLAGERVETTIVAAPR
jgi:hypothetical protein